MVFINSEHFHIPQLLRLTIIMWRHHHEPNFQQFLSVISIFCPVTENLKLEISSKMKKISGSPFRFPVYPPSCVGRICWNRGSGRSHQNFVNRPIPDYFMFHLQANTIILSVCNRKIASWRISTK